MNGLRLPALSQRPPAITVVIVAVNAENTTMSVVTRYAISALPEFENISWANVAKYMFSTIHAI